MLAYYSWYDYYYFYNWNYLFKESNVIPFLKSYDKCWHIIVGMIIITSIIGKYFYEVGGIAAMILFPLVIVFIIALFKEQI